MNQDEMKMGALSALDKIKKSEEKARNLLKEAKEQTGIQIIQDAQEEAKQIKEQLMEEARTKAKSIRQDVIKKAEKDASLIREQTQKETENLRKTSKSFLPEAEKKVSKEIQDFLKRGFL